ncbi:MAG: putative kinesin heavy chain, partial [Olpidium bornovanus]
MNGYNGTLLAYGQTGSGKTHTLASADGLIPRIINRLLRRVAADTRHEYKVTFSFIQIYQDKIYDLLVPQAKQTVDLVLRENPQKGVYVENMS